MKKYLNTFVALMAFACCISYLPKAYADSQKDWRLGMQAYSFNVFTFYEAVDKTKALGLKYIEAYPGQSLSKEKPNIRTHHNMSSEIRNEVLQKLQEAGVKLVNYGVVGLPNNEAECRKVFDFAKDMGIETIVSEPPEDAFDLIDKLCKEYQINVAIHNHPKPSYYWDPNTVLKVCQGRSPRIGACADTGHWMRSGVNPLEALRQLRGRIISLHFKDLNEFGNPEAHDVIWGTGAGNARALLTELAGQNFKGVFSIEYEYNWLNSMPEIKKCVEFFRKVTGGLSPDFNVDEIVNFKDFSKLAGYWSQDEPSVDIAPGPFGDGVVDHQDLAVLCEYWLKEVLPVELVAYWRLDETEGGVADDSAGDKDGTANGNPVWQPTGGQINGALEFNGIDHYVSTPFILDPAAGAFSIFAWVKGGGPEQAIISQVGGVNWLAAGTSQGKLMTELKATGRFGTPLFSEAVIIDGEWHRVGLTWDGSTRTLFVDGVEVAKGTQGTLAGSTGGLYIGAGKNLEPSSFWTGLIDDVRIYDLAITP